MQLQDLLQFLIEYAYFKRPNMIVALQINSTWLEAQINFKNSAGAYRDSLKELDHIHEEYQLDNSHLKKLR